MGTVKEVLALMEDARTGFTSRAAGIKMLRSQLRLCLSDRRRLKAINTIRCHDLVVISPFSPRVRQRMSLTGYRECYLLTTGESV